MSRKFHSTISERSGIPFTNNWNLRFSMVVQQKKCGKLYSFAAPVLLLFLFLKSKYLPGLIVPTLFFALATFFLILGVIKMFMKDAENKFGMVLFIRIVFFLGTLSFFAPKLKDTIEDMRRDRKEGAITMAAAGKQHIETAEECRVRVTKVWNAYFKGKDVRYYGSDTLLTKIQKHVSFMEHMLGLLCYREHDINNAKKYGTVGKESDTVEIVMDPSGSRDEVEKGFVNKKWNDVYKDLPYRDKQYFDLTDRKDREAYAEKMYYLGLAIDRYSAEAEMLYKRSKYIEAKSDIELIDQIYNASSKELQKAMNTVHSKNNDLEQEINLKLNNDAGKALTGARLLFQYRSYWRALYFASMSIYLDPHNNHEADSLLVKSRKMLEVDQMTIRKWEKAVIDYHVKEARKELKEGDYQEALIIALACKKFGAKNIDAIIAQAKKGLPVENLGKFLVFSKDMIVHKMPK